jgi:hypothetical protein
MRAKKLKNNLITYGIVIAAYILFQALLSAGALSSLLKGLLVPICVYITLAISLNLVVGISGELSLGHAGFMCVGAFSGAFFSKCVQESITVSPLRLLLAMVIGAAVAAVFGLLIGIPVLRLKGDYLAIVRDGATAMALFDKPRHMLAPEIAIDGKLHDGDNRECSRVERQGVKLALNVRGVAQATRKPVDDEMLVQRTAASLVRRVGLQSTQHKRCCSIDKFQIALRDIPVHLHDE